MEWCFVHLSYPLLLSLLLLSCWQLRRHLTSLIREQKSVTPWFVTALILTGLIFTSAPPQHRVVSDETMPLSLSRQLMRDGTVRTPTHAVLHHGVMETLQYSIADRPLLQATLLSILHRVAGYRPGHPFILNGILLISFLTLTGWTGFRTRGGPAAIALLGLIMAQPLFITAITSGGNDLLHLSLLFLSSVMLHRLFSAPSSHRFTDLLLVLLLLAHVRPESALFLILILSGLLLTSQIRRVALVALPWLMVTPLFLFPRIWQQFLYSHTYTRQFQHSAQPAEFSLGILQANLGHLLRGLLTFDFYLPFAPLVLLFTLTGALVWAVQRLRGQTDGLPTGSIPSVILVIIHLLFVLSYWGGSPRHPISIRYCLPFCTTLSLICWLFWTRIKISTDILAAVALCLTLLYLPVGTEGRFSGSEPWIRKFHMVHDWLKRENSADLLVIDRHPDRYTSLGIGAIDYLYWQNQEKQLREQLRSGVIRKILVIQDSLQNAGNLMAACRIDGVKLYPLHRLPVDENLTVTISEILP